VLVIAVNSFKRSCLTESCVIVVSHGSLTLTCRASIVVLEPNTAVGLYQLCSSSGVTEILNTLLLIIKLLCTSVTSLTLVKDA